MNSCANLPHDAASICRPSSFIVIDDRAHLACATDACGRESDMKRNVRLVKNAALMASLVLSAGTARADEERPRACKGLPSHVELRHALVLAQAETDGGVNFGR